MEKRMSNKFSLVITVLLIFVFCIQVYAETDTQQHGSISIALTEGKKRNFTRKCGIFLYQNRRNEKRRIYLKR